MLSLSPRRGRGDIQELDTSAKAKGKLRCRSVEDVGLGGWVGRGEGRWLFEKKGFCGKGGGKGGEVEAPHCS